MKDDRLVDEFLLLGIIANEYITKKEARLLKEYPIDFSRPWWETTRKLELHFDYLAEHGYGGDLG